jgi:hypothetical protein
VAADARPAPHTDDEAAALETLAVISRDLGLGTGVYRDSCASSYISTPNAAACVPDTRAEPGHHDCCD